MKNTIKKLLPVILYLSATIFMLNLLFVFFWVLINIDMSPWVRNLALLGCIPFWMYATFKIKFDLIKKI
tara:strand:+ start:878 stop:1084 length:207 start_codon:yes stop_codon:yes gene_type:complete